MMDCLCYQNVRNWIHAFVHDYDRLKNLAVILIHIQIGCSLIGSLGVLHNDVSLISLGISLFALSAIASNSQSLGRTYAVLLFCAILLDISWFIFFSHHIWNMSSEGTGMWFIISLILTLAMEILGFCVRFFSFLVWIQMYRLGVPHVDTGVSHVDTEVSAEDPNDPNPDLRRRLLSRLSAYTSSSNDDDYDDASGAFDTAYTNFFHPFMDPKDGVSRNQSASHAEITEITSSPVTRTLSSQ